MLKEVLEKSLKEAVTRDEASYLFREVQGAQEFLELAKVASKVRDKEVGTIFKLDGFMGLVTPCTTNPPCRYCGRAAGDGQGPTQTLTIEEIELSAKLIAEAGVRRVELGGGTFWDGAGETVIAAVKAVKDVAPALNIWINVGPALNKSDLMTLKELGVKEVCSSLETINPEIFKETKPGDSLKARMELAEEINGTDLGLVSVMMVGIGSSYEDYIEHLFWLKGFKNLSFLPVTGLHPIPGTPFQDKPMANPFEVAKVVAIARLVLRKADLSFGGMTADPRLLPLVIMSGGNRAIHLGPQVHRVGMGPHVSKGGKMPRPHYPGVITQRFGEIEFNNMLPLTTRFIKEIGMEVDVQ